MAYASVASLMRTIESLLTFNSPMQSLICDHREEFCALHEKVSSQEVFIKNFEKNNVFGEMTDFEVEVKEVASAVEYTIQLRLTEAVLGENKSQQKKEQLLAQYFSKESRIYGQAESFVKAFNKKSTKIQDKGKKVSKELEILLSLLRSTKDDKVFTGSEAELADMLQKSLKGKRYLIVLDDMWKSEAWDAVRLCFPCENKRSRILLTTRNTEVARCAGTENLSLQMGFIGPDESWNLLKSVAFANEALPSEFETIGKQIAEKCHGLPLTIAVVAGLLRSKRAIEDWENIAKDVKSSVTNDADERCSRVLRLSYNHLTSDLKTCLLHFGIFPEDSEISAKNLMRSWMAEGFLKLENDLEGEADKCLQELVDRCLVLVCKKSLDGTKIRSCKVHDLIFDLCLREVQRGNIFIMNDIVLDYSPCFSMQKMQPFKRVTGDKIYYCRYGLYRALLTPVHHQLRDHDNNDLLKQTLLELRHIMIDHFPVEILSLIWLRYLSLLCHENLVIPPEICRLWNVRTLIVKGNLESSVDIKFPVQIWGLMQLRHLKLPTFYLPDCPSGSVDKGRHLDFSNLQTISYLSSRCCTKDVILGIQNVKKLGIRQDVTNYGCYRDSGPLNNLIHLHQLETLSFTSCYSETFPATLKKLKLERTLISWSYLDIIAELPNLEVLKLMGGACCGEEWHPNFRGFTRLKLLLIEDNLLNYWKATNDNFLVLKRLVLKKCHNLKEIPIEFAEIPTLLQLIELTRCLPELGKSAARIQQEQEDLGNDPVDVRISYPLVQSHHNDDDDEEEEDSDVDVAEDDDDSDVDVAEDGDSDAAEHDDNYDLNWLFDVQNNLALLTPVHRQLRDHDALPDEDFVTSLTHTNGDNSPLRRIHSIFLFAVPSLSTNSNFELGHLNLIRVLNLSSMYFSNFPLQILSLFLLRYLSFSTHTSFGIPRGIRKLLDLQTFIVQGSVHSFIKFPELTWEIKQLRHLKLRIFYFPDSLSSFIDGERNLIWSNIQSVSGLLPYCCTEKVLSGIQNIKKLCIRGHVYDYDMREEVMDIREIFDLHQLETLSIKVDRYHLKKLKLV
ncbi:hypothetical protein P3S68_008995 [Capsicum galapagoense]